jgi:hypothetical protein
LLLTLQKWEFWASASYETNPKSYIRIITSANPDWQNSWVFWR